MNDENEGRKLRIHQILNRNGFYRLPLAKLLEILRLLQVPQACEAKNIQENVFTGLIRLEDMLKKPKNSSRLKNKDYFNSEIQEKTSVEVRQFMKMIAQQVLQSEKSATEPAMISLPNQPNPSLFPLMSLNPMGYSLKYPIPSKEQANMQMQMYYMNLYNYGAHPAMNINSQYSTYANHTQPFPGQQIQQQLRQPAVYEKVEMKQAEQNQQQQQIQKEQQQVRLSLQLQRSADKQMKVSIEQKMIAEEKEHVDNQISQEQAKANEQQHSEQRQKQKDEIQALPQAQLQIKKRPEEKILQFQSFINPLIQSSISKPNNQMKLVSNEIEIQTDLTLLNEMVQVFPRVDLFQVKKQKNKGKRSYSKKNKQQQKSQPINRSKQASQQQKKKDENENKNMIESEIKVNNHNDYEYEDNNKNTKVLKQFMITVSKEFLIPQHEEKLQQPEKQPQLIRVSSEFERLDKQMKQDLKKIKQYKALKQNLRDCFCKGSNTQQSADIFKCLSCNRIFHSSCLQYKKATDIEQCHICQLQSFSSLSQIRQVITTFYVMDDSTLNFQKQIGIAQYQYFLSKRIRRHQIELRCCKLNDLNNTQMVWPDSIAVMVHGKVAFEIHALGNRKRKDAIVLTQHIIQGNYDRIAEQSQVKIGINILPFGRDSSLPSNKRSLFAIGIYFVQKLQMEAFIDKYTKNVETESMNYLSQLMSIKIGKDDQYLQIEKVSCNLYDPFTRNLIKTPVRGDDCLHAQCFDLKTFLQFMYATKYRLWKCPVCRKQVRKLKLDKQFAQIIKRSIEQNTIPNQIFFMRDGRILLKISLDDEDNDETPPLIKKARKNDPQSVKRSQKIIKKQN